MISWSISAALEAQIFDHIVVSTDDDEIAEIAEAAGAQVPFRRPPDLSGDFVATRPVMIHAIEQVSTLYGEVDQVCCLYPTAPFLTAQTLRDSGHMLTQTGCDFVFSCAPFAYPIQRALRINAEGTAQMIWPEHRKTRSQDLEEAYHDAGQFYWGRAEAFLEDRPTFGTGGRPWVLPLHLVHDIDTPEDWIRAELAFEILKSQ